MTRRGRRQCVERLAVAAALAVLPGSACTGRILEPAPGAADQLGSPPTSHPPATSTGGRGNASADGGGGRAAIPDGGSIDAAGGGEPAGRGLAGAGGTPADGGGAGARGGAPASGGALGTGRGGAGGDTTAGAGTGGIWQPAPGLSWQWQLTGTIDETVDAQMFDVDLFDTSAATVATLHALGRKVVCYVSAGSFENWRPDAPQFPAAVKGKPLDGWPGEQWLDVRQWTLLRPVLEARMDLCRSKGFDGIELDNVDGYGNDTGFPLTAADQLAFNRALAASAHTRGLSVGLKNDLDQVRDLVTTFDWALNEECFAFAECDLLQPFVAAKKAVFNVEYALAADAFCPRARAMGLSSLVKHLNLDAYRVACP